MELYKDAAFHHQPCFDLAKRTERLGILMPKLTRLYAGGVFDIVVGCGLGSVVMSTLIADRLGCPLGVVRKHGEPTGHAGRRYVLPEAQGLKWLFVDDLVSSGQTLAHVVRTVGGERESWQLAGLALYGSSETACDYYDGASYRRRVHVLAGIPLSVIVPPRRDIPF